MAHFAKLDANNIVEQVIVVANQDTADSSGIESEAIGAAFCQSLMGASTTWKQTSYNGNFRGNYAGIGYTYLAGQATLGVGSTDIFIAQQPYASWVVGVNTAQWYPPANPVDLQNSPDFVLLYGVLIEECNVTIHYDNNRKKGNTWNIPLENNKFIMFPSTNMYYITNNQKRSLNFVQTITYDQT